MQIPEKIRLMLKNIGIEINDHQLDQFYRHILLIREWNAPFGLVSGNDLKRIEERHVYDSISLTPYVKQYSEKGLLLDIGSGGGFPAVPIKVLLPHLPVVLVERSPKRVGFLRKVVAQLGLTNVQILQGEFSSIVQAIQPGVITARAVERPDRILKAVLPFVERGATFLCQSGDPRGKIPEMFHVEHIEDEWKTAGIRHGSLYLIRKSST